MIRFAACCLLIFACTCWAESALPGHEYTYTAPSGLKITLGFDAHENRYFGQAVNRYYGSYQAGPSRIFFRPANSTLFTRAEEYMADEAAYFNFLERVTAYHLTKTALTLTATDGTQINFTLSPDLPQK